MTIKQAIDYLDETVPNMVEDPIKLKWLNDLDTRLYKDLWLSHEGLRDAAFSGYPLDADMETELLVPVPYTDIYPLYMEMMIHAINGETVKYNNAASRYNTVYIGLADWINRAYKPVGFGLRLW